MADQPVQDPNDHQSSALQNKYGYLTGPLSQCNGIISFDGIYHTFIIQFKANGFFKLFRLQVSEFVDELYCIEDVLGNRSRYLNEALRNAKDIQLMAGFADKFLLHFLNIQPAKANLFDGITYVSNELFGSSKLLSVEQYAFQANMSVRNFGRRFTEQAGIPPKLYCRLLRFNKAINSKLKNPQTNWTSIAYECGYYDQMHMIKEFQEFANVNPSVLIQPEAELTKAHLDLTGPDTLPHRDSNLSHLQETFVSVKRTSS